MKTVTKIAAITFFSLLCAVAAKKCTHVVAGKYVTATDTEVANNIVYSTIEEVEDFTGCFVIYYPTHLKVECEDSL